MKRHWLAWPYIIWMIIFIVVPMILVVFYSVTEQTGEGYQLTFRHFHRFVDPIYINVLIRSVVLALVSTIICLLLGYPMAAILAGREFSRKKIMYMLIVLPMWMNFLLRTYAWMTLLERNGVVNTILSFLNLPSLDILYTNKAVVLGMVYNFLPFMILPIYSVLSKIDQSVIEAAQDLGGNGIVVFRRVIFPLSLPGVVSGITMVFMPAVTTFVISRLLGGGQFTLIGNLIEQQFLSSGDWGFGSALSVIMMILILLSMGVMSRYEQDKGGGALW
ncbi:MAG: ABC transporter permease [Caldicoprobacterales bacterium]|jgi:spermidine/putrescine transport system permease protein|nr:ABC transporter permease [Clostridiales bacterium]